MFSAIFIASYTSFELFLYLICIAIAHAKSFEYAIYHSPYSVHDKNWLKELSFLLSANCFRLQMFQFWYPIPIVLLIANLFLCLFRSHSDCG